ncbi:MAG: 1,4-beta-xylanase [Planctomycetes bacterium]|nr:1,4-beta-xylanase [Planctomycetota bacterium]
MKNPSSIAVVTPLMILCVPLFCSAAETAPARPWPPEQARQWYDKQPWIVGCNYIPSTAVNWTEMWQKETFDEPTIDRELGFAAGLGMNTVRVFFQFLVWEFDRDGFADRFERFLKIADKHGIAVVPVFFDDCEIGVYGGEPFLGKQPDPLPGQMFSSWVPSPGHRRSEIHAQFPLFQEYVQSTIRRHAHDKRVLMWDLFNEVGGHNRQEKSYPLLEAAFVWAQEVNPDQPITACLMAWHDPKFKKLVDLMTKQSDVVTFHSYAAEKPFREHLSQMQAFGRPVICTEWLARGYGSKVETHLPLMKEQKVGAINWGLVNGRSQTHFAWGKKLPEPKVWHHDLLKKDGTPYSEGEVNLFRRLTSKK